ncbi:MAG: type II toxin-antitoxin system VapC family toxin [Verrucomicrobia bacterium]|nr:type II toxin-antitoxin system VapC family toxin [Verrucomicrobiota bacterium]
MTPYADTNFFTRTYLELPDSTEADRLVARAERGATGPLPVTWLHRLEVINAFQLHVFFGRSPGQHFVTAEQAALAQANFRDDLTKESFIRNAVVPIGNLERQFEELALRHTARHGFRTYDLLHVASALALKCDTFWSFDPKASKLAALEGLKVRC